MKYKEYSEKLVCVKEDVQLPLYNEVTVSKTKSENFFYLSNSSTLNNLSGKEWTKYSKSVQIYKSPITIKRKQHGAAYPLDLAKHFIKIYSKSGDIVLDPFAGVGTTLDAANVLERNSIGIEINKNYVNLFLNGIDKKDGIYNSHFKRLMINDNVDNIKRYIKKSSIDLIITSPPYSNLLNLIGKEFAGKDFKGNKYKNQSRILPKAYSDLPYDYGNLPYNIYLKKIKQVMKDLLIVSKEGCYNVWVVRDFRNMESKIPYINLHGDIISCAINAKWILWDTIIWDQSGQRKLVRLGGNKSRRFYFNIGHSYILVFRKNYHHEYFKSKA